MEPSVKAKKSFMKHHGCQTSMERFKADNRKAFYGKCLVVLQSTKKASTVRLTAKGVDLKSDVITLSTK